MRILIIGVGAVGGYFGGRLAQAGRDVTFLVRPSRAKQLSRDGLRIVSPHGDAVLSPKLVSADEIDTPYDLVFVSVKAYALDSAMNDFAAAVGRETMIFPVLNGMRHIDLLAKRFGEHAVIGGVCLVAAEIDDQGRIVQLADVQQLVYGERNGESTSRLKTLDATLQGAGFDAHLSADIMQEMWEKWIQLATLGAITCLMRGTIGEIVAAPGGAELSIKMLDESAAVATACGHKPSEDFLSRNAARGDKQKAQSIFLDARKRLDARWGTEVKDALHFWQAARIDAGLGRKEEAIREAQRAVELKPIAKDSLQGPQIATSLALVYAWTGERDRALEQLEIVATIPAGPSYGDLKFNPCWDSLRGDKRFDKIVAAAKAASR